jgi:uncharacterized protein (DUF1810 family)
MVPDPYDLQRFVEAQAPVYARVRDELRAGRKESHWMWFIFPQIAGLGSSPTSTRFAIASVSEAKAYLAHPVLGARLRECAGLALAAESSMAPEIFGVVDARKLHSSMTLFAEAAEDRSLFDACLQKFFAGAADPATLTRLWNSTASVALIQRQVYDG